MIPTSEFESVKKSTSKKTNKPKAARKATAHKASSSTLPATTGPKKMAAPKKSGKKKSNAMVVARPHGPVTVMGKSRVGQTAPGEKKPTLKQMPKVLQAALDQSHTIAAIATSGVMGYLEGNGSFAPDQALGAVAKLAGSLNLNKEAVLGIGAWVAGKYMKNQMIDHAATGLLSVGAWKLAFKMGRDTGVEANLGDDVRGIDMQHNVRGYDESEEAF